MLQPIRVRRHPRRLPSGARTVVADHTRNRVLDVGRSAFTAQHLKLHRYAGSLQITDLTNAGKRGKKARRLTVIPKGHADDERKDRLLKNLAEMVMHATYDDARAMLQDVERMRGTFTLHEEQMRGVDVEPAATKVHFSHELPSGGSVKLTASPHDFTVTNRVPHEGRGGRFFMDTRYYPAGTNAQQRSGARAFYEWVSAHPAEAGSMGVDDFRRVWDRLGVRWDSH